MGRKLQWPDKIVAPLPEGTLQRIAIVLQPGESKTAFLRSAIMDGLEIREASARLAGIAVEPGSVPFSLSPIAEVDPELSAVEAPDASPPRSRGRSGTKTSNRRSTREDIALKAAENISWLPRCQHDHCGVRADVICLDAKQVFCDRHKGFAVEPFALDLIGLGRR